MDLIFAYDEGSGSSSENEIDKGTVNQQSSAPQTGDQHVFSPSETQSSSGNNPLGDNQDGTSAAVVSKESQCQTDAVVSQSSSSDFFNLLKCESKTQGPNSKAQHTKSSRNEVDVPDGEFWSDFVPDEDLYSSQQAPRTSHEEYYRKQTMSDASSNKVHPAFHESDQNDIQSESRSRMHLVRSHPYLSPHGNISSTDKHRKATATNRLQNHGIPQTLSVQNTEKRKIYYIDSKVAPYLHTNGVFKPASKTSASWLAHGGAANRLNWNLPNFSHLLVTAGMDTKIKIWSVWSSIDLCVFTFACHTKAVRHVDWCHSGRAVFSCSFDRTAQITDVESGQTKAKFDHVGYVTAGALLSSNPNLVATGMDSMVFLWDSRTPQAPVKHFTYKETFGQVQDITFIADDRELVSCGDHVTRDSADRSIMVWDVRSSAILSNQVFQERYTCTRLKLHKDKSHFLAQTHGGYIALFSTSGPYRMEKNKRFGGHKLLGYHIGFDVSPDGKLVYSGSAEGGVHVYDYRTGKLIRKLASGCDDVIMDVACHPVLPSVLASCTWGGNVKLWQ